MKGIERLILILVVAVLTLGVASGIAVLWARYRGPATPPAQVISHEELRQNAAANPDGAQLSLWRQDPGQTVLLFGKAATTGAFTMPPVPPEARGVRTPSMPLRELMRRAGGLKPEAAGNISIVRKEGGEIRTIRTIARAELEDATKEDMVLLPGDVVHVD